MIESNFVRDDKIKLLSLSTSLLAMIEFFEEGKDQQIYSTLKQLYDINTNPKARVNGCKVNARGVLAGGVVGFFSGGATGAYVGCAGGTVTLPGIGTVVGCVGGAVFGAAGGFVGGVLSGVASELIQTCLR